MKKFMLAAAIAAVGVTTQAQASFTPIWIDPDGAAGGSGALQITTLNWMAGNALAVGVLGESGGTTAPTTITTQYQAQLNTFVNNAGGTSTSYLPVAGSQWTVVASITEIATGVGTANALFQPIGGTVSIYYNAGVVANDISGTGYDAGVEILRGNIVGGSGTFQDTTRLICGFAPGSQACTDSIKLLDSFGADNAGGVLSHTGNGQSTLDIDVTLIDSNFFLTDITSFNFALTNTADGNDTGQLVSPFAQANPSDLVVGVAPSYSNGVNGGDCPRDPVTGQFTQRCDFHFQTTNVTSFRATEVPEPGALALVGLGLGLLGAAARKRNKA